MPSSTVASWPEALSLSGAGSQLRRRWSSVQLSLCLIYIYIYIQSYHIYWIYIYICIYNITYIFCFILIRFHAIDLIRQICKWTDSEIEITKLTPGMTDATIGAMLPEPNTFQLLWWPARDPARGKGLRNLATTVHQKGSNFQTVFECPFQPAFSVSTWYSGGTTDVNGWTVEGSAWELLQWKWARNAVVTEVGFGARG